MFADNSIIIRPICDVNDSIVVVDDDDDDDECAACSNSNVRLAFEEFMM